MSNPPESKLKLLKWRLECVVTASVEFVAGLLPGPWVFCLGEFMGGIAWHLMPKRRLSIMRNLRIAYAGEKDLDEIRSLAKATMRRAGANLISTAYTAKLPPEQLPKILQIENMKVLTDALDTKKGVVLLLAHMGNWELLSRLIHFLPEGDKIGGMYRPLNNPYMDARVRARRQADGSQMFSKRDPFHQITKYLRDGGIVGVLADQRVGENGDRIEFFGRQTHASPLPSLLARRAKSEVVALSLVTEKPGQWKATFFPVERPHTTTRCMAALEAAMKSGPADVFWLQERWKVRIQHRKYAPAMLGQADAASAKPPRVLIWAVDVPSDWRPADTWLNSYVPCEFAVSEGADLPSWLPEASRCHQVCSGKNRIEIRAALQAIDLEEILPLDLILVAGDFAEVNAAALQEGVKALEIE